MVRPWMRGAVAALMLADCVASRPAVEHTPDQQAVLAVTERFFAAMRDRDSTALRAMLHPSAVVVMSQNGITTTPGAVWAGVIGRRPEPLIERIWDARVEVDGDIASLWAPYDFYIGERFSHCGHDAFHYVRERGQWRLVSVVFTRQTSGCTGPPRQGGR